MNPLTIKEWQQLIDTYFLNGSIESELYDRCDEAQRWFISEARKSINRLKNKI